MPSASRHSADPTCSRRTVLAGVAGLPAGLVSRGTDRRLRSTATPSATGTRSVTVATWNVSLGVDLFTLFKARTEEDVRETAADLLASARRHPYDARAGAIADALVAADADVVALQEAARIRAGSAGDADEGETVADVLDSVVSALEARGRPFEVAASTVTTDVELPIEGESGRETVRLTDRDALLVRQGVETHNAGGDTYDRQLEFPVPGTDRTVTLRRGYCRADVGPEGAAFMAVSTHLESVSAASRSRQASELLDALPAEGPVVVGGDFNSGPGTTTGAYDALTDSLTDAHDALRSGEDGDTCCRPSLIGAGGSRLTKRVDSLLSRGEARPTTVERLGEDKADRVETTVDGDSVTVWPSDHAGVVGTFEVPRDTSTPTSTETPSTGTRGPNATATGTEAGTGTPVPPGTDDSSAAAAPPAGTDRSSGPTSGAGSGFGVLAAAVAFVFAAFARNSE